MSSSSNNTTPNNSGGSEIAQLQKRLNTLIKELRNVATGNLDAKTKMEKAALLQQEIQIISAQIAALQREQKQVKATKETDVSRPVKQNNIGSTIDTYA